MRLFSGCFLLRPADGVERGLSRNRASADGRVWHGVLSHAWTGGEGICPIYGEKRALGLERIMLVRKDALRLELVEKDG
jgi:hypothetical protein